MATKALAQPLQNADELIDSVETFIFDCDGMLWYLLLDLKGEKYMVILVFDGL